MSELKEVITSYNELSISDRIEFYTTISNDIAVSDDMQTFLVETRLNDGHTCLYCEGILVVKTGTPAGSSGVPGGRDIWTRSKGAAPL